MLEDGIPQFFHCPNDGTGGKVGFGGKTCGRASCGYCLKEVWAMTEADESGPVEAYEAKMSDAHMGESTVECMLLAVHTASASGTLTTCALFSKCIATGSVKDVQGAFQHVHMLTITQLHIK